MTIETYTPEETRRAGEEIGKRAGAGEIFTLDGDLGAGKTVFTQGVAAGLGIREPVNSPTFTILQEYGGGRLPLYHFDVYRIEDIEEMEEIGYDDYFFGEGICLIEWAGRIWDILPEKRTEIRIDRDVEKGFDYRRITITETGGKTDA
ncbi:MAG: tRNA (adenosine(37)-N6)-threonylcarbamoyltransferase complex ATPase subunit type 1 TsaE [Clostridiales bacterium]|nr:tRNA (adenosine(37)-N6)-threonylcarbamoyltransferase complex ATPase subunit type 1 TsaE [Clostridiales bacterium]